MSTPPLPLLFVGCSSESLHIGKAVQTNLEGAAHVELWKQGIFRPSQNYLDDLLLKANAADFALFILSPDDVTTSRNAEKASPRDNTIFEAGLFMGALGRDRVYLLAPVDLQLKQPTDLSGMTLLTYREPSGGNWRAAIGAVTNQVEEALAEIGRKFQPVLQNRTESHPSYQHSYSSITEASNDIKVACREAVDLKVLSISGITSISRDSSVISTAELESYTNLRKLRVLLMSTQSRWLTSGLAARRERESLDALVEEMMISHRLVEIGIKRMIRILPDVKSGIRYYTGEPCWRIIMTDRTAFVSSYVEDDQRTQSRDLVVYRFDNVPRSFFGAFHRRFNDIWHNELRARGSVARFNRLDHVGWRDSLRYSGRNLLCCTAAPIRRKLGPPKGSQTYRRSVTGCNSFARGFRRGRDSSGPTSRRGTSRKLC